MTEIKLKLKTPSVPNFIRVELNVLGHKQEGFKEAPMVAVCDLTDAQLESLAYDWKEALLEKAEEQRKIRREDEI